LPCSNADEIAASVGTNYKSSDHYRFVISSLEDEEKNESGK
jgi:hypothetical protein